MTSSGVVRVSVFSPDDLTLVKGAPGDRRRYLDDTLVALAAKYDDSRRELDRIVRQRNVLLRQTGGRLDDDAARTLDVWDAKLVEVGERFGHARATLVERAEPFVVEAYGQLAPTPTGVGLSYDPPWRRSGLAAALAEARRDDLRRGVSTVGPHRDELTLTIGGLPARTHASQGEQRTLALALRLGAHRLVAERTGSVPVLVLDDVLSELDPARASALLGHLPGGQIVITTAGPLPAAAAPDRVLRVEAGTVAEPVEAVTIVSESVRPTATTRCRSRTPSTTCCARCAAAPAGRRCAACSGNGTRRWARPSPPTSGRCDSIAASSSSTSTTRRGRPRSGCSPTKSGRV